MNLSLVTNNITKLYQHEDVIWDMTPYCQIDMFQRNLLPVSLGEMTYSQHGAADRQKDHYVSTRLYGITLHEITTLSDCMAPYCTVSVCIKTVWHHITYGQYVSTRMHGITSQMINTYQQDHMASHREMINMYQSDCMISYPTR
jgi:hypothetical protein